MSGTSRTSDTSALFRPEALESQHVALEGGIVLVPHLSGYVIALAAALVTATVIAALFTGSYTRRATVAGQLVPAAGVLRVHAPQVGVVLEKRVNEGQIVKKGDVLYVVSSEKLGAGARDLQADIGARIDERKHLLEFELARNTRAERDDLSHLGRRLSTLKSESQVIERQIEQQTRRVTMAEDTRVRYQSLAERDYIAREQLLQKELDLSEQQSRLTVLQRDLLANQREIAAAQRDADALRSRSDSQGAVLKRGISSSVQERTELESRRLLTITAPESGVVTLVSAEVGQVVDPAKPLVTVVPSGSPLEARLYSPSRTIGFVRVGDAVSLRHQAFPYQKFGQQEGVVTAISTSAVPSTELAGFTLPDAAVNEPVYAITVRLAAQSITAYGEARPLQAGMRVDADIRQETRKLYEWLLEPLYSVSGRWQR